MNFECKTIQKKSVIMQTDKGSDLKINIREAIMVSILENAVVKIPVGDSDTPYVVDVSKIITNIIKARKDYE